MSFPSVSGIPIVDLKHFEEDPMQAERVAQQIHLACRESGFFYVSGHDVPEELGQRLEELSQQFFALELETKMAIAMEHGGRAWRGYFPVGGELTSGLPDQKEGLYFGAELGADHPKVQAGVPLHGANLFPAIASFRETVLEYIHAMTRLGQRLMNAIALSLGLPVDYFAQRYTSDPLILFRIFHYPPLESQVRSEASWGVGEHTDYGLLTMLRQDDQGGLEVHSPAGWISAPPIPGTFVCNIGDMLDRMTGGFYRSTPHRVLRSGKEGRLSFPFFFDPCWDAEIQPIKPPEEIHEDKHQRWDQASVHEFSGTYGEYILKKVAKVFPRLVSPRN